MKALLMIIACLSTTARADGTTVTRLKVQEFNQIFNGLDEVKTNAWENWGLTEQEWATYETIKAKTAWGSWGNEATPLQLLSIYATNIEEKRRYARLEARLDQWREDAVLTYQQIYNNEREVIHAKYAAFIKGRRPVADNLEPKDTVAFFTYATECDARCKSMMNRLLTSGTKIDVYVMDDVSQDQVFKWASEANIPVDRVQAKQITLNYDKGNFNQLSTIPVAFASIPVAYVKTEEGFVRLAL